jgi:multisubunit Na+/H+ antiporter MnhB subunit
MAAILQALFCAGIFIMIGFVYRPDPESRYRLGVSVIAFALCAVTGMQFMSITARILLEHQLPAVSWYNTAFYGLSLALVVQARGNVAKIWPAGFERWDGRTERRRTNR